MAQTTVIATYRTAGGRDLEVHQNPAARYGESVHAWTCPGCGDEGRFNATGDTRDDYTRTAQDHAEHCRAL